MIFDIQRFASVNLLASIQSNRSIRLNHSRTSLCAQRYFCHRNAHVHTSRRITSSVRRSSGFNNWTWRIIFLSAPRTAVTRGQASSRHFHLVAPLLPTYFIEDFPNVIVKHPLVIRFLRANSVVNSNCIACYWSEDAPRNAETH
jgi:hypothetical protein